jgi:Protein of unknown function (DUF2490)
MITRVRPRACLIPLALVVAMASISPASAQTRHDAQLWMQLIVTPEIAPDWLLHLEAQPRWSEDASELNHVILRGALGRRLGSGVSVWGGYAWIPRTLGPGTRYEHRIWQQVSATWRPLQRWGPSLRVRIEQRFQDGWADSSHRVRVMGRVVRPLDAAGTWNLAMSNEVMLTIDETAAGPHDGVDQNRLFGGVMRRLTPSVSLEGGYLWQTQRPPAQPRFHGHVALLWLNVVM